MITLEVLQNELQGNIKKKRAKTQVKYEWEKQK